MPYSWTCSGCGHGQMWPIAWHGNIQSLSFVSRHERKSHFGGHWLAYLITSVPQTPVFSLDGPFVEYKGNIPADERGPILEKLKVAFQELLEEDIATEIVVVTKEEAQQRCDRIKENYFNFDEFGDEPVRLVTVAGWTCLLN